MEFFSHYRYDCDIIRIMKLKIYLFVYDSLRIASSMDENAFPDDATRPDPDRRVFFGNHCAGIVRHFLFGEVISTPDVHDARFRSRARYRDETGRWGRLKHTPCLEHLP
jgi:hypothetical protein